MGQAWRECDGGTASQTRLLSLSSTTQTSTDASPPAPLQSWPSDFRPAPALNNSWADPSVSWAETQSSSWTRTRASRTPWSMGNPMEKSQLAALRAYHEPVSGPGRVGPHQDRMDDEGRMAVGEVARLVLLGQPRQCPVEEFDVIVGVVGSGVPRTQHGGQWLRSNQIAEVARLVNLGAVPVDVGQGAPMGSSGRSRGVLPTATCGRDPSFWVARV